MAEKKTKILKISIDEWKNESRDKRELSVCHELGMEVVVMAKGKIGDKGRKEVVDGFDVFRFTTRPLGEYFPVIINRIYSIFFFAHYARKINPDIISGHDLTALLIGWLSTLFKKNKPKLVYDSHEFELGRSGHRGRFATKMTKHREKFLMKRCAFSIMVNDIIADTVQQIHGLKDRPVVVRNIPYYWTIDKRICEEKRNELLSQMKNPRNIVLMYHGGVTDDRGIEMLLKVLSINNYVCLVIMGFGAPDYIKELQKLAIEFGVIDRVLFHSTVHINELWKYVGASDIGMITIPAVAKSYYYMLPNKFFENIQSETPVICSNYPAIAPLVEEFGVGLTCDPLDENSINGCIKKLCEDKELYQVCKENTRKAKSVLCWEQEKKVLANAYKKIL